MNDNGNEPMNLHEDQAITDQLTADHARCAIAIIGMAGPLARCGLG